MKNYETGDTPYSIHITFPGREKDYKNWDEMISILTILVSSWFRQGGVVLSFYSGWVLVCLLTRVTKQGLAYQIVDIRLLLLGNCTHHRKRKSSMFIYE